MTQPIRVLHVDDNAGERALTKQVFEINDLAADLDSAHDGVEAMAILRREGKHSAALRPDLILLDLNMPNMDGRDVLAALGADQQLRSIPVVLLSTSAAAEDVLDCYALGANCYITKGTDLDQFERSVKCVMELWGTVAKLPIPATEQISDTRRTRL